MLPGVIGGQGVLLGPFSGICLILFWHLIYLIITVPPTHRPRTTPPDFFLQVSPNLRAQRTALHSFQLLKTGMGLILLGLGKQDSRL